MSRIDKAIRKMETGKNIRSLKNELGLTVSHYKNNREVFRSDAEVARNLFYPYTELAEYREEIQKRCYRLTIMKEERILRADSFPLTSML